MTLPLRLLPPASASVLLHCLLRRLLQKLYTNSATRQIFDRLAHSSIMRLNTSSMEKLYVQEGKGAMWGGGAAGAPE